MKTKLLTAITVLCFLNISVAQKYKFGKVSKEELLQKEHPSDPTVNAAVLYREVKTEFQYTQDSGWYMVTDYFERVKIYNKEGFEWANSEINLYKGEGGEDKLIGLRGYTYYIDDNGKVEEVKLKNDGIFEEETSKYLTQTKITLPDVREGCIIEYKYTINSPFIFNIDEFRFQETIPVDKVNIIFKTPEYFVYKTHQRGWVPYKVNSTSRERTMSYRQTSRDIRPLSGSGIPETTTREVKFKEDTYTVDLENVPAMKEEAFVGNLNNYTTALQFEMSHIDIPGTPIKTYSTNWEDVSKSIYRVDSFGAELERKNYFEKDLNNLLDGVTTVDEKVSSIFSYVSNKMTWNGYNGYYTNEGVRTAYKKGSGNVADINLMLVAMLRQANIEANPVLVSTKAHGIPLFPTRNGFNYVIAAVNLPQGTLLLDVTNKDAEIGVLKSSILNWQGRVIKKDGTSGWVSLSSTIPAVKSAMVTAEITPDLSVSGKSQSRFTGNYAFKYRSDYKSLNGDAQRKKMEENANQAELTNLKFENLASPSEPVSLEFDFEEMHAVEDVAGKLYFSPLKKLLSSLKIGYILLIMDTQ